MSARTHDELLPRHEAFRGCAPVDRPLLLWGEISTDDWDLLRSALQPAGLSIQPIVKEPSEMDGYR